MENRKYTVCRDNIYVGEVITTNQIERYEGPEDNHFKHKPGLLAPSGYRTCRSMLFVPNEDNFSDDLLYQTPNYHVLNITDDQTCLNLGENSIVIQHACNLSALLEYFNYKKDLTYQDIMKIRNTFFTGRFAKDNCQLFGWKEIMAEDLMFFMNDQEITDPKEIKKCQKEFRAGQRAGHRQFEKVSGGILPEEYWEVLDARGNKTLKDVFEGWDESLNAFDPHKREGKIRKLTR